LVHDTKDERIVALHPEMKGASFFATEAGAVRICVAGKPAYAWGQSGPVASAAPLAREHVTGPWRWRLERIGAETSTGIVGPPRLSRWPALPRQHRASVRVGRLAVRPGAGALRGPAARLDANPPHRLLAAARWPGRRGAVRAAPCRGGRPARGPAGRQS